MAEQLMNNRNGRWQLAFWIVSGFFVMITIMLANNVIANDRIRAVQDEKLNTKIEATKDCIYSKMEKQYELLRNEIGSNTKKLTSIETKIEMLNGFSSPR